MVSAEYFTVICCCGATVVIVIPDMYPSAFYDEIIYLILQWLILHPKNRPQWRFSINSFIPPAPKIKNPSVGGTEGGFNA